MLHPSYNDLMNVVNSAVEPGEHPVVDTAKEMPISITVSRRAILWNLFFIIVKSYSIICISFAIHPQLLMKLNILYNSNTAVFVRKTINPH